MGYWWHSARRELADLCNRALNDIEDLVDEIQAEWDDSDWEKKRREHLNKHENKRPRWITHAVELSIGKKVTVQCKVDKSGRWAIKAVF